MPIEAMASRGRQTLLFGPMKPVGLVDKRKTPLSRLGQQHHKNINHPGMSLA